MTLRILQVLVFCALVACAADPAPRKVPKKVFKTLSQKSDIVLNSRVDILFLIDNSGSMSSFQKTLADNSEVFTDAFVKLPFIDFHLGSISTAGQNYSDGGGKLMRRLGKSYVTRRSPRLQESIKQRILLGSNSSGTEIFFDNIVSALSEPVLSTYNKGFYRENALLAIFVLTDTEDQGYFKSEYAVEFLEELKDGKREAIIAGAALARPSRGCRGENQEPEELMHFMNSFGGHVFDLCKGDFGKGLVCTLFVSQLAYEIGSGPVSFYENWDVDSMVLILCGLCFQA